MRQTWDLNLVCLTQTPHPIQLAQKCVLGHWAEAVEMGAGAVTPPSCSPIQACGSDLPVCPLPQEGGRLSPLFN